VFVESQLLPTCSEHLHTMRELASSQPESESLLVTCEVYQQQFDDLKRKADRHSTLLEYYDR